MACVSHKKYNCNYGGDGTFGTLWFFICAALVLATVFFSLGISIAEAAAPVSSSIVVDAGVQMCASQSCSSIDNITRTIYSDSQGASIYDLSMSYDERTGTATDFKYTSGDAFATWNDIASGTVSMTKDIGGNHPIRYNSFYDYSDWTYSFLSDTNGSFTLDYSSWYKWYSGTYSLSFAVYFDDVRHSLAGGAGSYTWSIAQDAIHTVTIRWGMQGGSSGNESPSGDKHLYSTFNWSFDTAAPSVVPEPVSSTLFIFGGVILGFRRFRKRFMK